jgi:small-conductance mechanosensitive channel
MKKKASRLVVPGLFASVLPFLALVLALVLAPALTPARADNQTAKPAQPEATQPAAAPQASASPAAQSPHAPAPDKAAAPDKPAPHEPDKTPAPDKPADKPADKAPGKAPAAEAPKAQLKPAPIPPSEQENATLQTLVSIRETLDELRVEQAAKRQALARAKGEEQKAALSTEIAALGDRAASLERSFESISTGADLEAVSAKKIEKFEINSQIQDILSPILQELKNLTERPREIERLRGQVEFLKARLPVIQAALAKLDRMAEVNRDRAVQKLLDAVRKSWESREQQVGGELAVAEYQLAEKLKDRTSVLDSLQSMTKSFFQTRGRNLLLSVVAFVAVFALMNLGLRGVRKFSPLHTKGRAGVLSRLFDILYHALTVAVATVAGLGVLYAAGDWLLLGLALIFLLGAAWAAKQSLSLFWEQCKLLLDLGTVREGERIVYGGLPYKVAALNVYSSLVNPALRGGRVRLPLQALMGMNSRPFDPEEAWFPSREGDWVLLPDNVFGRVACQTPESVQIVLPGGARRTFPAAKFVDMNPTNLSTGFRARTVIGLDYGLQGKILDEIPAILKQHVKDGLERAGHKAHLHDVNVGLGAAGASSLDLGVMADFDGAAASKYMALTALLHQLCVEACTENGWNIPFQQVVVRREEG